MKSHALTPLEVEAIRAQLAGSQDHYVVRDRALFEVGLNAGLRISEALALNVGQILQHGRIVNRLELIHTKDGKHRAVPLNTKA